MPKAAKLRWMWHILHEAKNKPAPNTYNHVKKEKFKGAWIERMNRTYIDEMMYRAYATPGFYENIDSLILKKTGFKGVNFNAIKSDRFKPIVKTPEPGPGAYKIEEWLEKLRKGNRVFKISPAKKISHVMHEVKKRSGVPAVGHYKGLDLAYEKIFKPPRKPRR